MQEGETYQGEETAQEEETDDNVSVYSIAENHECGDPGQQSVPTIMPGKVCRKYAYTCSPVLIPRIRYTIISIEQVTFSVWYM